MANENTGVEAPVYPVFSNDALTSFGIVAPSNPLPVAPTSTYKNISSNATTVVKSGAGYLGTITINTKGATANTATVYDNTAGSGTVIATIDTTGGAVTLTFNAKFATGLTVVTATGTAANITVCYS